MSSPKRGDPARLMKALPKLPGNSSIMVTEGSPNWLPHPEARQSSGQSWQTGDDNKDLEEVHSPKQITDKISYFDMDTSSDLEARVPRSFPQELIFDFMGLRGTGKVTVESHPSKMSFQQFDFPSFQRQQARVSHKALMDCRSQYWPREISFTRQRSGWEVSEGCAWRSSSQDMRTGISSESAADLVRMPQILKSQCSCEIRDLEIAGSDVPKYIGSLLATPYHPSVGDATLACVLDRQLADDAMSETGLGPRRRGIWFNEALDLMEPDEEGDIAEYTARGLHFGQVSAKVRDQSGFERSATFSVTLYADILTRISPQRNTDPIRAGPASIVSE